MKISTAAVKGLVIIGDKWRPQDISQTTSTVQPTDHLNPASNSPVSLSYPPIFLVT